MAAWSFPTKRRRDGFDNAVGSDWYNAVGGQPFYEYYFEEYVPVGDTGVYVGGESVRVTGTGSLCCRY